MIESLMNGVGGTRWINPRESSEQSTCTHAHGTCQCTQGAGRQTPG
jgi:hypothetical protein